MNIILFFKYIFKYNLKYILKNNPNGDWGLGIGYWGLRIGHNGDF